MDYLPGGSLENVIAEIGPIPKALIQRYAKRLLGALVYIHKNGKTLVLMAGIIHRDIKSANLLLDSAGELKLADFGSGTINMKLTTVMDSMVVQKADLCESRKG